MDFLILLTNMRIFSLEVKNHITMVGKVKDQELIWKPISFIYPQQKKQLNFQSQRQIVACCQINVKYLQVQEIMKMGLKQSELAWKKRHLPSLEQQETSVFQNIVLSIQSSYLKVYIENIN